MNRRTFFLALAGAAGCTPAARRRLNILNWSEYIAPDTIPAFEREFGVRIRYGTFESAEEMLAKVATGNSGWDVVICTNNYIQPMAASQLLAPLRHDWLPNIANIAPRYNNPPWDPALRWSVPYLCTSTGIISNASVEPQPDSWASLWEDRYGRRATMLDDPNEVIGACLIRLGYPLNSIDSTHLARARDAAIESKRILRAYINAEGKDAVVAGDVLVAQMWTTTAQLAMDANSALRFSLPVEGYPLASDNAVVLAESRRAELAHRFIDYLLRPATGARIASAVRSTTPNARAFELLPAAVQSSPVLYPASDVLARGQWFEPLPPEGQRLRDRIWTEIKSA